MQGGDQGGDGALAGGEPPCGKKTRHVREVSLRMEDADGVAVCGGDSQFGNFGRFDEEGEEEERR